MTKQELFQKFQENWSSTFSPFMQEDLEQWIDVDGLSPELINEALRFAVRKGHITNLAYINGILRNWKSRNILTVEEVRRREKERERLQIPQVELTVEFYELMMAAAEWWSSDEVKARVIPGYRSEIQKLKGETT